MVLSIGERFVSNDQQVHSGLERWRFKVIYILLGIVFSIYIVRLFSLQIINGEAYLQQSE